MRQLGSIRGVAILAVVMGHAAGWGMFALGWWGHVFNSPTGDQSLTWLDTPAYFALMSLFHLAIFSVPTFLFAGAWYVGFVAQGASDHLPAATVRAWLKNLLPPFLIWVGISAVLHYVSTALVHSSENPSLANFMRERAADYYFVPLMAEFFVLSPLMVKLARRHPGWLLSATLLLDVLFRARYYARYLGTPTNDPVNTFLDTWGFLFFWGWASVFAFGLLLATHQARIKRQLQSMKWTLAACAVVFEVLSVIEGRVLVGIDHNYADADAWKGSSFLFALAVMGLLVTLDLRRGWVGRMLEQLGTHSYGVYLVQGVSVGFAARVLFYAGRVLPIDARPWIFPPILLAVGIGLSLLVMWLVAQSPAWRYQRLLFGGSMRRRAGLAARPLRVPEKGPAVGQATVS